MSADQITETQTLPSMCRVYHRAGAMCYVWLEMADRAELVQRARELVPQIRQLARRTETLRRIPREPLNKSAWAGIYRLFYAYPTHVPSHSTDLFRVSLGKPSRPSTTRRSCAPRSRSGMEGWGYPSTWCSTWCSTWQPSSGELWIHGLVLFYLGQPQLAGRDVP